MCEAFQQHFERQFTKESGDEEFHSYVADFPRILPTEAISIEWGISDGRVYAALKKVGKGNLPGLNGLS